jgi:N-acetylneuraminate synthase
MRIADREISAQTPPFILAEMSGNHNQSLDRALAIVDAAADAGAHGIKLQTFTPEVITLDHHGELFRIQSEESLWSGEALIDLYREAWTPWEWHQPIIERAQEHGMICLSTPFHEDAVDFLEGLNMPAYKIASFESAHFPLLRKVAATGKPVIMSTGMATTAQLAESVQVLRDAGCQNLMLLKCTSSYPASPEHSNLRTLPHLRDLFKCEIGLSDHTPGIGVATSAVALGATLVEKHFTLNRSDGGLDAAFSLEPYELRNLVLETERAWQGLGRIHYGPTEGEKGSLVFRRSLFVVKDIKAGEKFTQENVRIIRPGYGLEPKYLDTILGRKAVCDLSAGTPLSWENL